MRRADGGASTVLDVCLFCLLVGAAVATLSTMPAPQDDRSGDRADETASALGRTTVTVEYDRWLPGAATGAGRSRTAHGTVAGALATAAVTNATVEHRPLDPGRRPFVRAVGRATDRRLAQLVPEARVGVTAVWRPYEGAPMSGRVHVGERPPPTAAVHAATLSVPSGLDVDRDALAAADSYPDVAKSIAVAVIDDRFPPAASRRLLGEDGPPSSAVTARYQHAATVLGADVADDLAAGRASEANSRLAAALAATLAADLRERFETPEAAKAAVAAERVSIVVRTWSA